MTAPSPDFGERWVDAWNSRDLTAILPHYRPEVVFRSPNVARAGCGQSGELRGLEALGQYFRLAFEWSPELHFSLVATLQGVPGAVTLLYTNDRDQLVAEAMTIEDGQVASADVSYGSLTSGCSHLP